MRTDDTLPRLFKVRCERQGNLVAMRHKKFGIWHEYTWKDCWEKTKHFSLGLICLGLEPQDKVCLLGDTEPEMYWAMYGIWAAGAVPVGIWADADVSEVKYIVAHSDAKFAVVNDQEQTDKMQRIKDELPNVKRVIWWDPKGMKK